MLIFIFIFGSYFQDGFSRRIINLIYFLFEDYFLLKKFHAKKNF